MSNSIFFESSQLIFGCNYFKEESCQLLYLWDFLLNSFCRMHLLICDGKKYQIF